MGILENSIWFSHQPEHVASLSFLEERINMYISAMDTASAVNDSSQSSQLQRDIQVSMISLNFGCL